MDYFYPPFDRQSDNYQPVINQIRFNAEPSMDTLRFSRTTIEGNEYFIKRHGWGVFAINSPERADSSIIG